VSCGIIDGEARLDLNYEEDSIAEVDMNFVITGSGHFVEIQGTAETKPFTDQQFQSMAALARKGHDELFKAQNQIIGSFFPLNR
jgi:ribonuclease PH